jgi:hypothetical protein
MKKLLYIALAALTLSVGNYAADEKAASSGKEFGGYELTLGGSGTNIKGQNSLGADVSLSTNPFEKLSNLWLGAAQSVYWEPSFSGSTDIFADWNWHLFGELYLNTGWSAGAVYDKSSLSWRTGPEATFQYYVSDGAFIYTGVNYDIPIRGSGVERGFRYSVGIGLAF